MLTDSLFVWIEAGRKLDSDNPGDQDILVVKNTNVALGPGATQIIPVEGVCCQAKNSSPDKGSRFSIGKMAPALWVVIANFISAFNFDRHTIQQAIWVLSDEHDIRSIPVDENSTEPGLREKVAEILDIPLPWYAFKYAEDSTTLFSGDRTHVFAYIPFEVPYSTIIHGLIYNQNGEIVYQSDYTHARRGQNFFKLNVDIVGWVLGKYKFELMEDLHTVNLYRTIDLDLEEG